MAVTDVLSLPQDPAQRSAGRLVLEPPGCSGLCRLLRLPLLVVTAVGFGVLVTYCTRPSMGTVRVVSC